MKTLPQAVYDARPFTATDTHAVIGKWVEERIAEALKAERERIATCFEHLAEKAYEETHFDMYTEFHRVADELRGHHD